MSASVDETLRAIDRACQARGGKYKQYSCKYVSWDDVSRGTVGGSLSCWGANITDTYLDSKDGRRLFTVRSNNWNEKLGRIGAEDLSLVVGSHNRGNGEVSTVCLKDFLKQIGAYGTYAGLSSEVDLSDASLDLSCSIRFQTTFLPVSEAEGTMEFTTKAYNYNTRSDTDPRNLVLLCTSEGVAVQQDGAGTKRLFLHKVDSSGAVHQHWLEAERSRHVVGGPQIETDDERKQAQRRGKAIARTIGIPAMGSRFNTLMTVQVPLCTEQERLRLIRSAVSERPFARGIRQHVRVDDATAQEIAALTQDDSAGTARIAARLATHLNEAARWGPSGGAKKCVEEESEEEDMDFDLFDGVFVPSALASSVGTPNVSRIGTSNAARVSCGSDAGVWDGCSLKTPVRNRSEHVTITVVMYHTVTGGVPSEDDVVAAIDDLESLYAACQAQGRLADPQFNFMKAPLVLNDIVDIVMKLFTQPANNDRIPMQVNRTSFAPLGVNIETLVGEAAPACGNQSDLLCTYAALVLHDDGAEITPESMTRLIVAAGCRVERYWPMLFCKMIRSVGMHALIAAGSLASVSGGSTGASDSSQPAAGGAPGGGGSSGQQEEKAVVEEEEDEAEMDFDLFG